jgi:hypothetical protein
MKLLFHRLLNGDENVLSRIGETAAFWRNFHIQHGTLDHASLAREVSHAQFYHEQIIGERHAGKMSMPFVAIGVLYDEGFGFAERSEYAVRLAKAFLGSSVSVEVHGATRDAVLFYDLYDYDSELKNEARSQLGW